MNSFSIKEVFSYAMALLPAIGIVVTGYVYLEGFTAQVNMVTDAVQVFSAEEKLRDTDWLARESAEHKGTEDMVIAIRDRQGEILQRLTAIDQRTETLVSQHERRFEELETEHKMVMQVLTDLAYELGEYKGHHDNETHEDAHSQTGTHP